MSIKALLMYKNIAFRFMILFNKLRSYPMWERQNLVKFYEDRPHWIWIIGAFTVAFLLMSLVALFGVFTSGPKADMTAVKISPSNGQLLSQNESDPNKAINITQTHTKLPADLAQKFSQAVMLIQQNNCKKALVILKHIETSYPDHIETLNNMAVCYAQANELELAKVALERAMKVGTAQSISYNNLVTVYGRLANLSYQKVKSGDVRNPSIQEQPLSKSEASTAQSPSLLVLAINGDAVSNQALIESMQANQSIMLEKESKKDSTRDSVKALVASSQPTPLMLAPKKHEVQSVPAQDLKQKSSKEKEINHTVVEKLNPPPMALTKATGTEKTIQNQKPYPKKEVMEKEVFDLVLRWAKAWSNKNTKAYLEFYSPHFQPPDGKTLAAWKAERTARLNKKENIRVDVKKPTISLTDNKATVTFIQYYQAGDIKLNTRKTLKVSLEPNGWKIIQEGH